MLLLYRHANGSLSTRTPQLGAKWRGGFPTEGEKSAHRGLRNRGGQYPEPGSNRYGLRPQDFKSGVSTNSTTRASPHDMSTHKLQPPPRGATLATAPDPPGITPLVHTKNARNRPLRLYSLSGKRDSNSRPQPWQGCALPTELFPQDIPHHQPLFCTAKVSPIFQSAKYDEEICSCTHSPAEIFRVLSAGFPGRTRCGWRSAPGFRGGVPPAPRPPGCRAPPWPRG